MYMHKANILCSDMTSRVLSDASVAFCITLCYHQNNMEFVSSSLVQLVQRLEKDGSELEATTEFKPLWRCSTVGDAVAQCIQDICRFQRPYQVQVDAYNFCGLHSAIVDALDDNS